MASVSADNNITETVQAAAAVIAGHDLRMWEHHSNPDIDPAMVDENLVIVNPVSETGDGDGETLIHNVAQALQERVQEYDNDHPPKRVKKDRTVCLRFNVPCPMEPDEDDIIRETDADGKEHIKLTPESKAIADAFFTDAVKELNDHNFEVVSAVVHYDEIHEYVDNGKVHISRPHMHVHVMAKAKVKQEEKLNQSPDAPDEYRINGKDARQALWTKKNGKRTLVINKLMDAPSIKHFGRSFEDGTKKMSRGSVEHLKEKSHIETIKLSQRLESGIKHNEQVLQKQIAQHEQIESDITSLTIARTTAHITTHRVQKEEKEKQAQIQAETARLAQVQRTLAYYVTLTLRVARRLAERSITLHKMTAIDNKLARIEKDIETAYKDSYPDRQKLKQMREDRTALQNEINHLTVQGYSQLMGLDEKPNIDPINFLLSQLEGWGHAQQLSELDNSLKRLDKDIERLDREIGMEYGIDDLKREKKELKAEAREIEEALKPFEGKSLSDLINEEKQKMETPASPEIDETEGTGIEDPILRDGMKFSI